MVPRKEHIWNSKKRHLLSRLSLVCKAWSCTLRGALFQQLTLRSISDVQFLIDVLVYPLNSFQGVRHFIKVLILDDVPTSYEPMALKLTTLFPLLPATRRVTCSSSHWPSTPLFTTAARRSFLKLTGLAELLLEHQRFPKFMSLASLLAKIPRLETLTLRNVTWSLLHDSRDLRRRGIRGLPKLARLFMDSCSQHWPPVFLFLTGATSSARDNHNIEWSLPLSDIILVENMARTAFSAHTGQCDGLQTIYQRRWGNGDSKSAYVLYSI